MKIILIGCGSIGSCHLANLMALRPAVELIVADPLPTSPKGIDAQYSNWRQAIEDYPDADGAIIASPTDAHLEQMTALAEASISFYVEKPLWSENRGTGGDEWQDIAHVSELIDARDLRCTTGFQYRYHAAVQASRETWRRNGFMSVCAYDDLLTRYGRTVGGTMASHPIDLALWTLGDWHAVDLFGDGATLHGAIAHEGMGFSHFDIRMNAGARTSRIATHGQAGTSIAELQPDNDMYMRSLGAWLEYIETGKHDGTLATLADGMAVMQVLDQCLTK